jgi:hypothetical protein
MAKHLLIGFSVLAIIASLTYCKMFGQKRKGNAMEINYSGEKLALSDIQGEELFQMLQTSLAGCSDVYKMIVTDKVIDDIKKDAQYLEIRLANPQEIVFKTGKKVVFKEMLVPLSGKYAPEDQLTFFLSNGKEHQTPYLNTNGLQALTNRLHDLK